MGVTLGYDPYGKAETRVVRVYRDADRHELAELDAELAFDPGQGW